MQKEKSDFKIKAGSHVFGIYTIDFNKKVQSEHNINAARV